MGGVPMGKKVLILDDEEDLCKEVVGYLKELGYDAYYCTDGEAGLEMLEKKYPDLLLVDIRMPKLSGLEVLHELTRRYSHLVVVVISGYLDRETTIKAIEYGAATCVDKPFKLEELAERVIKPLIGPGK